MIKTALVGVLLLATNFQAWAVWDAVIPSGASVLEYTTGGVTMSNGPGTGSMFWGRTFSTPSAGASLARTALVTETATALIGGNSVPLVATRSISALAIGEALAGGAAAFAGGVNVASAVAAAGVAGFQIGAPLSKFLGNTSLQIGKSMCTATNTGWNCDVQATAQPDSRVQWCYNGTIKTCADTPGDAAMRGVSVNQGRRLDYLAVKYCDTNASFSDCELLYGNAWEIENNQASHLYGVRVNKEIGTVFNCKAYIDALNPAWSVTSDFSVPEGTQCATGRYNASPSPSDLSQRIAAGSSLADALPVVQKLAETTPIRGAVPEGITGPASVVGTPSATTTVNPDRTTTTTTKTPTTSYVYGPSTVNYSTTNVSVTNNAGNVTTTTTTEGSLPVASDQCKANPNLPQCALFGELPTDKPEIKKTTITYAAEDVPMSGGCPAPYVIRVRSWDLKLNYQPACDVAPLVKPGLVALTALSCMLFIVGLVGKT